MIDSLETKNYPQTRASYRPTGWFFLLVMLQALFASTISAGTTSEIVAKEALETGLGAIDKQDWQDAIDELSIALETTKTDTLITLCLYFRGYAYHQLDSCVKAEEDLKIFLEMASIDKQKARIRIVQKLLEKCPAEQDIDLEVSSSTLNQGPSSNSVRSDASSVPKLVLGRWGLTLEDFDSYASGLSGGLEVVSVEHDSPADRAEFRAGQVIIEFGEITEPTLRLLGQELGEHGYETIQRKKRTPFIVKELDGSIARKVIIAANSPSLESRRSTYDCQDWGLTVAESLSKSGVSIVSVVPNSCASKAGIQVGDDILKIYYSDITDLASVKAAYKLHMSEVGPSGEVVLFVRRGDRTMFVNVNLGN